MALFGGFLLVSGWAAAELPAPAQLGELERMTPEGLQAERPRFSPDASRVVFQAGPVGARDLYVIEVATGELTRLTETPFDARDPAFRRDGESIVYAANPQGSYDLFERRADGSTRVIAEDSADLLEPAPSPIAFTFFAVGDGGCGPAVEEAVETYDRLLYTRRTDAESAVWSMGLSAELEVELEASHRLRLSPEGSSCDQPAWSGDGLALALRCVEADGSVLYSSDADYEATGEDSLRVLLALEAEHEAEGEADEETRCNVSWGESDWLGDGCLQDLPRRYPRYPLAFLAEAEQGLVRPGYSANQIAFLAVPEGGGEVSVRSRVAGAEWRPFELGERAIREAVWAPDGTSLAVVSAHQGESAIYRVASDFYLQEVVNLRDFPELWERPSARLQQNRFVARPGSEREFFHLYDQLSYQRRPVFITADAVLQAFHDEFAGLLQAAEGEAEQELRALTEALFGHYAARAEATGDARDRFMAAYFAVPRVFFEAGLAMEQAARPADYDHWECAILHQESVEALSAEDRAYYERACLPALAPPPVSALLAQHLPAAVAELPEGLREAVGALVDRVLAREGVEDVPVPGGGEIAVDFTQFTVRGDYATAERADYFLAVMWYGQVPLPLDAATVELALSLAELDAPLPPGDPGEEGSAYQRWQRIDAMVGGFMGEPVQATVDHLRALAAERPNLLSPLQADEVATWLRERYLGSGVRGLEGASGGEPPPVRFALLPRRLGLDVTFFSRLTHPAVPMRGLPSALDVWASLGVERGREQALAAAAGEEWAEAYHEALDEILAERAGADLSPTDIYSSWLAALRALARSSNEVDATVLPFAANDAWRDRLLFSTLAGYAQLKHAAVLYAMEEYGVQCGGELWIHGFAERPVIPPPRGFVDPVPAFFEALVRLADAAYEGLNQGAAPEIYSWYPHGSSVRDLAARLAELAHRQVAGQELERGDYGWMQQVGSILEMLFFGTADADMPTPGEAQRAETGVALTVGIYTNVMRGQVLHLGLGRLLDLYVAVPDRVGQRLTQGGLFSVYEFWHPMADRLTDEAWNERIESEGPPPLFDWARSFIEEGAP